MSIKQKHYPIILITLALLIGILAIPAIAAEDNYRELPSQTNIHPDKANWAIEFSLPIDSQTLTEQNIYIIKQEDQTRHNVKLELSNDKKVVYIIPQAPYALNSTYRLYIEAGLRSSTDPVVYFTSKSVMKFTTVKDKNAIPPAPQINLNIDEKTITGNTDTFNFVLKGSVDSIAQVTVNGKTVNVKEKKFSQEIKLTSGNNTIEVIAKDDYGQITKKTVIIKYQENDNSNDINITSNKYIIDNSKVSIIDVPYNTSVSTFKNNITPVAGATIEVYKSDQKTLRTGNVIDGDVLIVCAADQITKKAYPITVMSSAGSGGGGGGGSSGSSSGSDNDKDPSGNTPGDDNNHQPDQVVDDLKVVSSGLDKVINQLSSEPEKAVARVVKNNIDRKIADPSFDHTAQIDEVRIMYNKLTPEQKENVQNAVLYYIPAQRLIRLAEYFGFK